jgi:D-glycero-D-manno-heptose 1,7-bisphosphate phosphatase
MGRGALFLDRDGVVNVDKGYIHKPEECEFIPGIFALAARARDAGMPVIIVTNQAGIARGYYSEAQFQAFTEWMQDRFAQQGAPIAAVYYCPHHPTAGLGVYRCLCSCRKPAPGMLLMARDTFDLDLTRSAMVGDMPTDMLAAAAAGVPRRWRLVHTPDVPTGTREEALLGDIAVTWETVQSLAEVHLENLFGNQ